MTYYEIRDLIQSIEQAMFFKAHKFGMWAYHMDVPRALYESRN